MLCVCAREGGGGGELFVGGEKVRAFLPITPASDIPRLLINAVNHADKGAGACHRSEERNPSGGGGGGVTVILKQQYVAVLL